MKAIKFIAIAAIAITASATSMAQNIEVPKNILACKTVEVRKLSNPDNRKPVNNNMILPVIVGPKALLTKSDEMKIDGKPVIDGKMMIVSYKNTKTGDFAYVGYEKNKKTEISVGLKADDLLLEMICDQM